MCLVNLRLEGPIKSTCNLNAGWICMDLIVVHIILVLCKNSYKFHHEWRIQQFSPALESLLSASYKANITGAREKFYFPAIRANIQCPYEGDSGLQYCIF